MGWRSIRLSFEHPEFFTKQIRAILRAAAECETPRQVRMLFPMITALEEIKKVRTMVRKACEQLKAEGKKYHEVQLGIMIEVPAAAISIQDFLSLVDFVSIGSNDLVQYLMAADRDNPKVSHLCQPLSPPVLRTLAKVIRAARQVNTPITLCGEMAGQPRSFLVLFGMGLRSFSMSPAFIPTAKELTTHLTEAEAHQIVRRAMTYRTTAQVKKYLGDQLARLDPKIAMLDTA
jgi:phosphotransferase system enzyme I (PtsI)